MSRKTKRKTSSAQLTPQERRKKRINHFINLILVLVVVTGLGLLAYPTVADWWNNMHQSRAIASYVEQVSDLSKEENKKLYEEAVSYNKGLLLRDNRYQLTDEELQTYNSILDVTGTGIMGYINIPKININLPIYHGTEDTILQIAIGHIEGTSLPVGGKGTHCVVSGHRGLASAKLFTDLDKLTEGDTFQLQTLNYTMTYEVDQIRIVLPHELEDLDIDPEQDLCTLVTCTPYGINTHRLLVRGHRVENAADEISVTADAIKIDPTLVAPVIGAVLVVLLLIWGMISSIAGRRKKRTAR
ncbi:MAG: class C sortase [Lachnospiraceae bacterium]|nr:class C sortase [Lachnospiraceae bacterium]